MTTQEIRLSRAASAAGRSERAGLAALLDKTVAAGLLAVLVFTVTAHGAVEPWSLAVMELLLTALLLAWSIKAAVEGRLQLMIPAGAAPMIGLLGIALVQSVAITGDAGTRASLSLDVEATRQTLTVMFFLTAAFVLFANFLAGRNRLFLVAGALTVLGSIVAAFALIQYFTWQGRLFWLRSTEQNVFGPFVNHNHFAGYMAMLMPVPLALIVTVIKGPARLIYGCAAALMGAAAVASGSRSGVLSMVAAVVFIVGATNRLSRHGLRSTGARPPRFSRTGPILVVVASAAAVVLWIGATGIVERFGHAVDEFTRSGSPDVSRAAMWRDTTEIIRDHPWTGAGFGSFETVYPSYADDEKLFALDYAHNDYLQLAAEAGIAGFLLAALFIGLTFRAVLRGMRSRDPLAGSLALACGAAVVAALVQSLSETVVQIPSNALVLLLLCAVASRCALEDGLQERTGEPRW